MKFNKIIRIVEQPARADNGFYQIHPVMDMRGRSIGGGRGKPAPTGRLGTTVCPDLSALGGYSAIPLILLKFIIGAGRDKSGPTGCRTHSRYPGYFVKVQNRPRRGPEYF